jgi:hypothetical protein
MIPPRPKTLPSWLDHFNSHDLKTLFRCVVAVWVALLLTFIHPSLQNFGQATFFAALVLYACPPSNILFLYILASFSLLLGMCLAWAWGLLSMKAALSARPDDETRIKVQALQQAAVMRAGAGATKEEVQIAATNLVHDGFMLDIRVTVTFFALGCLFIYVLARVRCANQKFVLTQIFGTITSNLFIVYGPTLPAYNPSLASVLVKPAAAGTAIGLACCVLFFPQSTSYTVLDKLEKLVLMSRTPLAWTSEHLGQNTPGMEKLRGAKRRTIGLYKVTEPLLAFLPLDWSRCRWNADDVKVLQGKVRKVMMATLSLVDLHIARVAVGQKRRHSEIMKEAEIAVAEMNQQEKDAGIRVGRRQMMETAKLLDAFHGAEQGAIVTQALSALQKTTGEVIEACSNSMTLVARAIHTANTCRWFRVPSASLFEELARELDDSLAVLRSAKVESIPRITSAILEVHKDLFDENGHLKPTQDATSPALLGIVNSMVVEERIVTVADATEELLELTISLVKNRRKHRIWMPKHLQYAASWLFDGGTTVPISNSTGTNTNTTDPGPLQRPRPHHLLHLSQPRWPSWRRSGVGRWHLEYRLRELLVLPGHWH